MTRGKTVAALSSLALMPVGARPKVLRLLSLLQGVEDLHRVNDLLRQIYSTFSLITPEHLGLNSRPLDRWFGLCKQKHDDVLASLGRLQLLNVELGSSCELLKSVVVEREKCLAELDDELRLLTSPGGPGSSNGSIDTLISGAQSSRDDVARDVESTIALIESIQAFAACLVQVRQSVLDIIDRRDGSSRNKRLFIKLREEFISSVQHCITITA